MPALGVPSINLITALRERRAEVDLLLPEKSTISAPPAELVGRIQWDCRFLQPPPEVADDDYGWIAGIARAVLLQATRIVVARAGFTVITNLICVTIVKSARRPDA